MVMADMKSKVQELYSLEQLASKHTVIHRLHPMAKFLTAVALIVTTVSFGRYDFLRLLPYLFYTFIIMALSEISHGTILKRFLLALPFCAMAGISNIIFDRKTAMVIGGIAISYGVLSLFTIMLKAYLCVTSVLILIATTPISQITASMRAVHIPKIFVTLFELTYRYIGTLLEEAGSMHMAYMLRSPDKKGVDMKHMGSFVGQLLLRSFDRSERVYDAMKCRGYGNGSDRQAKNAMFISDWLYLIIVVGLCVLFRAVDVPAVVSLWIGRGI